MANTIKAQNAYFANAKFVAEYEKPILDADGNETGEVETGTIEAYPDFGVALNLNKADQREMATMIRLGWIKDPVKNVHLEINSFKENISGSGSKTGMSEAQQRALFKDNKATQVAPVVSAVPDAPVVATSSGVPF